MSATSLQRTMVIDSEPMARAACAFLLANWAALLAGGKTLACRFFEYKEQRSLAQQGLMWLRLEDVAEQVWVDGVRFCAKGWHEHFKKLFLPDETGPTRRCRAGYRKWAFPPFGDRVLLGSTTELTVAGMAEYLTQIEAEAVAEYGVRFRAHPDLEAMCRR